MYQKLVFSVSFLAVPFSFQLMFEQTLCNLKRNKMHDFGAVHLKEIIKTNHVQLNSRISRQWFSENVF